MGPRTDQKEKALKLSFKLIICHKLNNYLKIGIDAHFLFQIGLDICLNNEWNKFD